MKKGLLGLIIFTAVCSTVFASEVVVSFIEGTVEVQKKGRVVWENIKSGHILKSGDKIRTGNKSKANTISKDGHRVLIKEKTVFEISQLGPAEWDFKQTAGKVRLTVSKLSAGQSLRVKTPTAVCSVRGTEFEVTVLEDQSTVLDVFQGMVGLTDIQEIAPEISVLENQRSTVQEGAAPKPPETIPPDTGRKQDERPPKETPQKEGKIPNKDGRDREQGKDGILKAEMKEPSLRDPAADKKEFRNEILKEVHLDLNRDQIETKNTFDLQASQYEEAKTLIDAFGQRVRLEEYITRPTPESFKFVSLNTRANRFDFGFFEVVANKTLPQNLSDAGNLWFSAGVSKPEFYAVKQRWFVTNTVDSVHELALDGDSKPVTFQEPQFSDSGQFLGLTNQKGFQTVFDHRYEFINGNPDAIEKIWSNPGFRPADNGALAGMNVTGMMWHMRPVQIELIESDSLPPVVQSSFWRDVFVTRTETAGESGPFAFVTHEPDSNPNLAHFTEKRSYINFVDTNGNGRFDHKGEGYIERNGVPGRQPTEPFFDVVRLGLNGSADAGKGIYNGIGDSTLFSDLNRNGALDAGIEPAGFDPFVVAQRPWAWQTGENFMINDLGQILDLRQAGVPALAEGSQEKELIADAFEKVNFERVWTSSEFGHRKIDIVMSPRIFLKANVLNLQTRGQGPVDQK